MRKDSNTQYILPSILHSISLWGSDGSRTSGSGGKRFLDTPVRETLVLLCSSHSVVWNIEIESNLLIGILILLLKWHTS